MKDAVTDRAGTIDFPAHRYAKTSRPKLMATSAFHPDNPPDPLELWALEKEPRRPIIRPGTADCTIPSIFEETSDRFDPNPPILVAEPPLWV